MLFKEIVHNQIVNQVKLSRKTFKTYFENPQQWQEKQQGFSFSWDISDNITERPSVTRPYVMSDDEQNAEEYIVLN